MGLNQNELLCFAVTPPSSIIYLDLQKYETRVARSNNYIIFILDNSERKSSNGMW